MIFELTKASENSGNEKQVEINSLDDLQKLEDEHNNHHLIISFTEKTIEIYDDYRE